VFFCIKFKERGGEVGRWGGGEVGRWGGGEVGRWGGGEVVGGGEVEREKRRVIGVDTSMRARTSIDLNITLLGITSNHTQV
jgi:hypothetical protein